jgi:sec-independent protein translocase protein TatC
MKTETLASMRKLIVVGIFVVAAILTPSPDPVSQLLLAIPLVLLFEITLLIAGRIEKKAPKTPQDQGIQGR